MKRIVLVLLTINILALLCVLPAQWWACWFATDSVVWGYRSLRVAGVVDEEQESQYLESSPRYERKHWESIPRSMVSHDIRYKRLVIYPILLLLIVNATISAWLLYRMRRLDSEKGVEQGVGD